MPAYDLAALVSIIALAVFLVIAAVRRSQRSRFWALASTVMAIGLLAAPLIERDALGTTVETAALEAAFAALLSVCLGMAALGDFCVQELGSIARRVWIGWSLIWLLTLALSGLGSGARAPRGWMSAAVEQPTLTGLILVIGLIVSLVILLIALMRNALRAPLPELIERSLFLAAATTISLLGVLLRLGLSPPVQIIGSFALVLGVGGVIYAVIARHAISLRDGGLSVLQAGLTLVLTVAVIAGALYTGTRWQFVPTTNGLLLEISLGLLAALIYLPIRRALDGVFDRLRALGHPNETEAVRTYTSAMAEALERDALAATASTALASAFHAHSGALIFVSAMGERGETFEFLGGIGKREPGTQSTILSKSSPIYRRLAEERRPFTQYDFYADPALRSAPLHEREFFMRTGMRAYAPFVGRDGLLGMIAVGPKRTEAPYTRSDLELLLTLANATGAALRNARLVDELRRLNEETASLNRSLRQAKEQIEQLDAVKTDFITIASHELRTPLAQIRGYSDILDTLNEPGLLDQERLSAAIANLRRAIDRMDEMVNTMLDVSQLDVNALNLKIAPTLLEGVMRTAIEPMTDAIKARKLTLVARGLRHLPTLQADSARLVQAFRNIINNAVKYTPDGGRIEIVGSLAPAGTGEIKRESVLIAITDTGVGIAPENIDLIFRKFYRAGDASLHSSGSTKYMGAGPGLGLTIAKGIIEAHGGEIWAESSGYSTDNLPGTTFYVLLPVTPPDQGRRTMSFDDSTGGMSPSSRSRPPSFTQRASRK